MLQSIIRHRVSVLACAIATAIIGIDFSMAGKPTHAALVNLSCIVGGETATYSPGLTNTQQPTTITVDGEQTTCVSLSDPTIKSADYKFPLQGNLSCLNTALPPYDITYHFNNGNSSTVHYDENTEAQVEGETPIVQYGEVTSGEFKGDMATRTITEVTLSPQQCLTPQGVPSVTGVVTVQFTR